MEGRKLLVACLYLTMWITAFSTIIFTLAKATRPANDTDQLRLVNTIFEKYDKSLRPVANTSDVINVTLNPALFSIVETGEAAESITIILWFRMIWNDIFIQWNPSDYGGMQQLLIPISRIWVDIKQLVADEKNYAIIDNDGTVLISVVQVLKMHCGFDIVMFPFDIQNCTMIIASWMHTGAQMDIFFRTPTDLDSYNPNSDWNLISMTARRSKTHYDTSPTAWVIVYYDILIQRKPAYYVLTFVLPCFMITSISIIGIFSPFNDEGGREEKVTMGLTTLLTMTVILTLIADKMPKSSQGMPLLAIYVMLQIAISAIASLMAVIIMYLHLKWTTGSPVPTWILVVAGLNHKKRQLHQLAKIDMSGSANAVIQEEEGNILKDMQSMIWQMVEHLHKHHKRGIRRKEWQRAVQRLDLNLIFIFLFLNVILTVGFLLIGYSYIKI